MEPSRPDGNERFGYAAFALSFLYGLYVRHHDVIIVSAIFICLLINRRYGFLSWNLKRGFFKRDDEQIINRITRRVLLRLNSKERSPCEPPKQYLH